jgi:hypothetical protein
MFLLYFGWCMVFKFTSKCQGIRYYHDHRVRSYDSLAELRLRGDIDLSSDEDENADPVLPHDVEADFSELERLNTTFVAAACNLQEEQGFAKAYSPDSEYVDARPYVDEQGEELLETFCNQHGTSATAASGSGASSSSAGIARPMDSQRKAGTLFT